MTRLTRQQFDTIGELVAGKLIRGGTPHGVYQESVAQAYELGSRMVLNGAFKREFIYSRAGAALVGNWGAANLNHVPDAPGFINAEGFNGNLNAVAPAGARTVSFTDTVAKAVNFYANGYFIAYTAPIQQRVILSGPIAAGTAITLTLDEPLAAQVPLAAGVTAVPSPYSNLQPGTDGYQSFMCVPLISVVASRYFWGQVRGPCIVTAHGGTWPGVVAGSRDVYFHIDGSIDPWYIQAPAHATSPQRAGYLMNATVNTWGDLLIMLQLD
jgi:hypothetical protein